MQKKYALQIAGKNPERLLDAVRHDIKQQFKRLRAKALPSGAEVWRFSCRLGPTGEALAPVSEAELGNAIAQLAQRGASEAHLEIVAEGSMRGKRPAPDTSA